MSTTLSQGKNHGREHPLVAAIRLKKKAEKFKANSYFIKNIEDTLFNINPNPEPTSVFSLF